MVTTSNQSSSSEPGSGGTTRTGPDHRTGPRHRPGRRSRSTVRFVADIHDLTVTEQAAAIRDGQLSPVEITDHYLDRIDRLNEQVGAFYTVTHELAREQAAAAEKAVAAARKNGSAVPLPPLTGVPIPIKDLNMVAGVRMTLGSTAYADIVAPEDDYVVAELRKAGIVITGKTATPEFGLPCYTETKIGPPAQTPWELSRWAAPAARGERRRRLDPDPGQRVRAVRDQAAPRPDLRRPAGAGPVGPGHRRPAGPHGGRRGAATRRDDRQLPRRHVHPAAAAGRGDVPRLRRP